MPVIEPLFTTVTLVSEAPPSETDAPETKLLPETVTAVPPAVEPDVGEIPLTVGAGAGPPPDDFGSIVPSLRNAPGDVLR